MATARSTSRWRGQKINAYYISVLQKNCFHRIRRKTTTPEATFIIFLSFSPLTTNVTRTLPLEVIKEEAVATSRRRPDKCKST
jgi:hypothetical protein